MAEPSFVAIALCPTASLGSRHHISQNSPRRVASSLYSLLFTMSTTTIPNFSPGEAVTEQDGLIHGVSAQELQVLGEQAFDARARAYCMFYEPLATQDLVVIMVREMRK